MILVSATIAFSGFCLDYDPANLKTVTFSL